MKGTGNINFFDAECFFVEEQDYIYIVPKRTEDIKKIRPHFEECDFILKYKTSDNFQSLAVIERMELDLNHTIKLFPKYSINRFHKESFTGFEITGDVIDDFFSPPRYFYNRSKFDKNNHVDLLYSRKIADEWKINFKNSLINISLSYGDVFQKGVFSDLKLHSRLTINFERINDIEYIYQVYSIIVRFLKIIRYDTKCGELSVLTFDEEQGKVSYNGYFRDYSLKGNHFHRLRGEVEYGNYKPYIQKFLQFAVDNSNYTFHHYPSEEIRFRGRHYSAIDYLNIFAAFEAECHARKDLYENVDTTGIQEIKNELINFVEEYPKTKLKKEEIDFLNAARNSLLRLGTELGLRKKVKKSYKVLHNALDSSIENIFFLPKFRCEKKLKTKELNTIVEFLVAQRGAIAHGSYIGVFSDEDAQKIHFLEILTYAQLLKRVGLKDTDIERVIGVLFGCNSILFNEKYMSENK